MIFTETKLKGAFVIEPERHEDERGFFARVWDSKEFAKKGLARKIVQQSISFNKQKGTLRGMHWQARPHEENKLVHVTRGKIYDVIIDMRRDSGTYKKYFAVELSGENRAMLWVPKGLAHGFLTLEDNTEVFYQMSEFYSPEHARGVRFDDPAFNVSWPEEVMVISERDKTYPDFTQ